MRSAAAPTSGSPVREKRRKVHEKFQRRETTSPPPNNQSALLLHATRQPYKPTTDRTIPEVQHEWELLVKVEAIGLNPIDWKAP